MIPGLFWKSGTTLHLFLQNCDALPEALLGTAVGPVDIQMQVFQVKYQKLRDIRQGDSSADVRTGKNFSHLDINFENMCKLCVLLKTIFLVLIGRLIACHQFRMQQPPGLALRVLRYRAQNLQIASLPDRWNRDLDKLRPLMIWLSFQGFDFCIVN